MATRARDNRFDTLKGILICLVVWGHVISNGQFIKPEGARVLTDYVNAVISAFHIQAFIFISGYFSKKASEPGEAVKAVKAILLPLIVRTLLSWALGDNGLEDFLTPPWTLWFLLCLFCWKMVVQPFARVRGALVVAIVVALGAGFTEAGRFLSISRMLAFFPFFLAGYQLDKSRLEKLRGMHKAIPIAAMALAVAACLFMAWRDLPAKKAFEMLEPYSELAVSNATTGLLLRAMGLVIGFAMIFGLVMIVGNGENVFTRLGKYTMPVYLLHSVAIKAYVKVFEKLHFTMVMGDVPFLLIALVIAALICLVFGNPLVDRGYRAVMDRIGKLVIKE